MLLVVIGRGWLDAADEGRRRRLDLATDFVRVEIESALERNIPVIPLLVDGAGVPPAEKLPPSLANLTYRNGIPIRYDPDFHPDVDRLIAGLTRMQSGANNHGKTAVLPDPAHWKRVATVAGVSAALLLAVATIVTGSYLGWWIGKEPVPPPDMPADHVAASEPPVAGKEKATAPDPAGSTDAPPSPEMAEAMPAPPVAAVPGPVNARVTQLPGLPPAADGVSATELRSAFDDLFRRGRGGREAIEIGLWFGDYVTPDDVEAIRNLASAAGDRAHVAAMAYEGRLAEEFLRKPGAPAETAESRVTDGRKMLDDKRVDVVILIGFLRSAEAPGYLPKRVEPLSIARVETVVAWTCQAGKDALVVASKSDASTWDPHLFHRADFQELSRRWRELDVDIVSKQDDLFAVAAAAKSRQVAWLAGPSRADFEGFFQCVRSRDSKGRGDITKPCDKEK